MHVPFIRKRRAGCLSIFRRGMYLASMRRGMRYREGPKGYHSLAGDLPGVRSGMTRRLEMVLRDSWRSWAGRYATISDDDGPPDPFITGSNLPATPPPDLDLGPDTLPGPHRLPRTRHNRRPGPLASRVRRRCGGLRAEHAPGRGLLRGAPSAHAAQPNQQHPRREQGSARAVGEARHGQPVEGRDGRPDAAQLHHGGVRLMATTAAFLILGTLSLAGRA